MSMNIPKTFFITIRSVKLLEDIAHILYIILMNMDISNLDKKTIYHYAELYLLTVQKRRERIKKYSKTEKGRENNKRRSKRFYYRRNDVYHPEFNPTGTKERRYKRSNVAHK